MRNYSDLLPSYLDGENIRRHSSLIERSDRYLDGLVELFGLWDKLERPILIKREQTFESGVNDVTLYVNTPTPITEIIIEGDIEETIIPEDTVTTSYTNTWTIENPSIEIYSDAWNSIMMPSITVTVRTETHTYTKTYPENDTIQNDSADHDIFLDIVGGLLGIPRRQYTETSLLLKSDVKFTEPSYMAKQVEEADNKFILLPCSEDDYYYYERLNRFIQSQDDHLRLFHTIYDKDALILRKEDNLIPAELVGTGTTVLFTHINKGGNQLNNLNIDTTNIQQIAEQSLPITRPVQIYPYASLIRYSFSQEQYVNRYKLHLTLGLNAKTVDQTTISHEVPIANLPVNISYSDGTELGTFITDETGTAHISIDGARSGLRAMYWDLTREYPYFDVIGRDSRSINYDASLFKLSLSDDAWQYKIANGTAVTDFELPTILTNNNLDCGRGYMVYTPAINPQLVDLTDYTLHVVFHYTTSAQRLLLGTLRINESDIANITGLNIAPRSYESSNQQITATHTLDFKFTNGVCNVYYDGNSTGVSKDFTGTEGMLYIAGYNSRANGSTQGLHIEEISVGDEPTPTPVTLNLYGKGQTIPWSTTQWTTIEINAAGEAHCNYTKRNAILKNLPLSGDFTLVLNIQASHNTTWNWGLIPSTSSASNPAMKVSKGDTLNGSTSIATMFDHGSGVWDTTVPVTITRSGTTYTLEYNGNSYSFTGSTDTLYFWMDKTGSGNLFLTYIETTATMQ